MLPSCLSSGCSPNPTGRLTRQLPHLHGFRAVQTEMEGMKKNLNPFGSLRDTL